MATLTPMMAQYHEIKAEYRDYILFFRLGDFYEMFFDDAIVASKALDITLTKRQAGGGNYAPLCGVPYHSVDAYLAKLINQGFKVAICEQVEDPALAKGIVKREVVRLVTPGTLTDPSMLDENNNNYIVSLIKYKDVYGLAYCDITSGDLYTLEFSIEQQQMLCDEIIKLRPSEVLTEEDLVFEPLDKLNIVLTKRHSRYFSLNSAEQTIIRVYKRDSLKGTGIENLPACIVASGGLLNYFEETQKTNLTHFTKILYAKQKNNMVIDNFTRVNLELTETIRNKDKKGSLLWVLDHTKTAMGSRLLKYWLEHPLIDVISIKKRLDSVKYLYDELIIRTDLRALLANVYDLERLMSKVVFGSLNPKDALALKQSLLVLPEIKRLLIDHNTPAMVSYVDQMDTLEDIFNDLNLAISEDAPFSAREGGIFKAGYNKELDSYREISENGKRWLLNIEAEERQRTGIKNLKIGYNKIFGYFIEVSKGNVKYVPDDYHRKQTLTNAERYILPKLKEIEDKIIGAEERIKAIEFELFTALREHLLTHSHRIKATSVAVSELDCLASFAHVSAKYHYTLPTLKNDDKIIIKEGRHPVVERIVEGEPFIPNDTIIDNQSEMVYIITGPNMAGKSTYLRQVALITLMAQIGCFVPAKQAIIGVVDRIFTRVGASDDLFGGQSTFMVEMNELSNILSYASKKSLIILDEIGRGTSTYDGLSIAWAVVEYIAHQLGAKTMFATHYHELTELEGVINCVVNYCISVKEKGDDIVFLRKIIKGGANQSFGIQVAKLAGVPRVVINRAKQILKSLEDSDITKIEVNPVKKSTSSHCDKPKTKPSLNPIDDILENIDVNQITPVQALVTLGELKALLKKAK